MQWKRSRRRHFENKFVEIGRMPHQQPTAMRGRECEKLTTVDNKSSGLRIIKHRINVAKFVIHLIDDPSCTERPRNLVTQNIKLHLNIGGIMDQLYQTVICFLRIKCFCLFFHI